MLDHDIHKLAIAVDRFRYIKIILAVRLEGHKHRKLNDHVYLFLFLCPLVLTIKLNLSISQVAHSNQIITIS